MVLLHLEDLGNIKQDKYSPFCLSLRKTPNKLETITMEIFQEQNTKIHFSIDFNSATAICQSPKKYWWNLEIFTTNSDTNITTLISGLTWLTLNITYKHPQAHRHKWKLALFYKYIPLSYFSNSSTSLFKINLYQLSLLSNERNILSIIVFLNYNP